MDIDGYQGLYQISNHGRVKSYERRRTMPFGGVLIYPSSLMKPDKMKLGYLRIGISKEGKRKKILVHVLVAVHFLGPAPQGKEVNHKDGNKANNYFENLEYVTKSANILHSYRVLGRVNHNRSNQYIKARKLAAGE